MESNFILKLKIIQFLIGGVPEYKSALEEQLGEGALEKFDKEAKINMTTMNKYSSILYKNFKEIIL